MHENFPKQKCDNHFSQPSPKELHFYFSENDFPSGSFKSLCFKKEVQALIFSVKAPPSLPNFSVHFLKKFTC